MKCICPSGNAVTSASVDLVVRTTLPPAELASAVRAALKPIEPNLPANDFRTIQQLVDKAVSPRRFVVLLLGGFALFALVLASLGIYGVISYSVNQRTQEIGIRMALGASAGDLQARIILQTLGLAAIGMLLGAAASWALAQSAERASVRSDPRRSRNLRRHADRPDGGRRYGRLPTGPPGFANRSDGGAASGLAGLTQRIR